MVRGRITVKTADAYEHRYAIDRAAPAGAIDAPLMDYHPLTARQQYINQFHNEVRVLQTLKEVEGVPELLSVL